MVDYDALGGRGALLLNAPMPKSKKGKGFVEQMADLNAWLSEYASINGDCAAARFKPGLRFLNEKLSQKKNLLASLPDSEECP